MSGATSRIAISARSARPARPAREGHEDAYERVKALTRGQRVTLADFRQLFAELDVSADVREELEALTPAGYTGVASELVEELE